MRYPRLEILGFVVGLEVGFSKGVLDKGVLRGSLEREIRVYEGDLLGKETSAVRSGMQGMAGGGHPLYSCPQDLRVCLSLKCAPSSVDRPWVTRPWVTSPCP